jgi:hypothetical protein
VKLDRDNYAGIGWMCRTHENARRLIDRRAISPSLLDGTALEYAEHDGSDEGECDIGGNNAQSAD